MYCACDDVYYIQPINNLNELSWVLYNINNTNNKRKLEGTRRV